MSAAILGMPSSLRWRTERVLSRIRMTHFSPQIVATVATRTSTSLPSISVRNCPSWGRRRSTMFMPAMILMRLISPTPMEDGRVKHLFQRAVDPVANPESHFGRLDVDVGRPVSHGLGQDAPDDLHDRRVVVHHVGSDRRGVDRPSAGDLRPPRTPGRGGRGHRWPGSCSQWRVGYPTGGASTGRISRWLVSSQEIDELGRRLVRQGHREGVLVDRNGDQDSARGPWSRG